MKVSRPDLRQYFVLPNPGLRAYFARTEEGNTRDYRPPFWKGESRESVVNRWLKVLHKLGVPDKYPSLFKYEEEMMSKVGPMSIQAPLNERLEEIKSYFDPPESNPVSREAIEACIQLFKPLSGVRLRAPEQVMLGMDLTKNSGSPYFTKKRNVMDKPLHSYPYAAILGWRGQEGGIDIDDVKQRVIWMLSFGLQVAELQFYQPAIEVVQRHKLIPAYIDFEYVSLQVTALFDSRKSKDQPVICTDFFRYDQHFGSAMQNAAHDIIMELCPHLTEWGTTIFPQKYNVPLICSSALMFSGPHGLASGSGGTNFDESLAHKALQFDYALSKGAELNPHSMAYGDDGILSFEGIDVDELCKAYESHGQVMNPDKQAVSTTDAIVLRRWHSTEYRMHGKMVGVYATFRALGRLLAQERFYDPDKWGPKQVILRAWSILENCKYSPYFEQFVDFVMEGDKYRLGIDLPGGVDAMVKHAAIDDYREHLGYVRANMLEQGVHSWRIYKYLKTKEV